MTASEFADQFVEYLFRRHPEWRRFQPSDPVGPSGDQLVLVIPSPVAGRTPIELEVNDEEATIFFDRWHGHYGQWAAPSRAAAFANAVDALEGILDETIVVTVDDEAGRRTTATLAARGSSRPIESGWTRRTVSFKGSYDSVESAA